MTPEHAREVELEIQVEKANEAEFELSDHGSKSRSSEGGAKGSPVNSGSESKIGDASNKSSSESGGL